MYRSGVCLTFLLPSHSFTITVQLVHIYHFNKSGILMDTDQREQRRRSTVIKGSGTYLTPSHSLCPGSSTRFHRLTHTVCLLKTHYFTAVDEMRSSIFPVMKVMICALGECADIPSAQ